MLKWISKRTGCDDVNCIIRARSNIGFFFFLFSQRCWIFGFHDNKEWVCSTAGERPLDYSDAKTKEVRSYQYPATGNMVHAVNCFEIGVACLVLSPAATSHNSFCGNFDTGSMIRTGYCMPAW